MPFSLQGKIATVFGATGFVGRYVVGRLAQAGATVQVVTRHRQSAYFLRTLGSVGQIVPRSCAYKTHEDIDALVKGSAVVVNCLGILTQNRRQKFSHIHTQLPDWIAQSCARHGVERCVHISALSVDRAESDYAKSKLAGEKAVFAAYPLATVLRPSVIFGAEDKFFNMFARLAQLAPALPLIGGGMTKFQPVYVGDVADAVLKALTSLPSDKVNAQGRIFELGGPEVLTFKEIYQRMFAHTHNIKPLLSMPWGVARVQAAFMSILPEPPLTGDQITSLKTDNVVHDGTSTLQDLGIVPTALDVILPNYLDKYRPGGRFADKKRA